MIELLIDLALAVAICVVSVRSQRQHDEALAKVKSAKERADQLHLRISGRLANHIQSKLHG